ncbi:putative oxidoreductase YjmC [Saccoglossus kowalevskii]
MELAIKKAKEAGIGWVVAKGSNHYSIAGYYSLMAVENGLIGMSFTNTSPLVVPTRARKCVLGTNPITCAAPAKDGDSFVLDMATSAVALGKIEIQNRKELPVPHGWGVDSKGKVATDPKAILDEGGQLPLGGTEETSGYKGYGLGMMVEMFCGIMGNAEFGPNIRKWRDADRIANLGQCFVAIDPESFAPGFTDRMQSLIDICRGQQPAEGESEVLVAGDPERKHMKKVDHEGLKYHRNLIDALEKLAEELKVDKMKIK